MSQGQGTRAILAAFLANLGVAAAKLVGFVITGAASMLAEAIHSVADTANQALLFLGGRRARKEPDEIFQFGYGRERFFWSFVVALVLFSMGSIFSIVEGIGKLAEPHQVEAAGWAIGILVVAIGFEGWSLSTARREALPLKGDHTWWRFIRVSTNPELPVVLLEDTGALVGLTLALLAIIATVVTGDTLWDALGTLSIGLLLGTIAIVLAVEMKGLLIGEGSRPDELTAIERALTAVTGVRSVLNLRTQYLGPETLLVGAKVEFDPGLNGEALAVAVDRAESAVRGVVPHAHPIYVEPDLGRGAGIG